MYYKNKDIYHRLENLRIENMKKTYKFLLRALILAVLFCIIQNKASAELDLTKNKEFILTFLPNYHNYWTSMSPSLSKGDSIFIFIYAEIPTKGKIAYRDRNNNLFEQDFDIPNPDIVYVFKKPAKDYALIGYNVSGRLSVNTDSIDTEQIREYTFKIKADFPVQVYGHSQAVTTAESFNVLPIESLGNEYIILAYNANTDMGPGTPDGRTPSQFAVIAVEDSTTVTITPSVPTYFNGLGVQTITLNAGQVYLVQTSLSPNNPDLSSSIVRSNKPVAVFSGQQRARVPVNSPQSNASRDYLVEQMPPVDSWSNEAIAVPFPKPSDLESSSFSFDMLRVIAAYDNTQLLVNGNLIAELNSGEIYEDVLTSPIHIKANAPIMAAGYKRSSAFNFNPDSYRGDPLLQIIPTPNQYGEAYRFISIQAYESGQPKYDEHFVTIITEPDNIPTLLLNGNPVQQNIFAPILGSFYRYAHIRMGEGTHKIAGNKPFGLFVCGYGNAVSYGYFCGVISKRDDFEPPELQSSTDCFEVEGKVTDKKLKSLTSPANQLVNTLVNIETFSPYVTEAKFSANLVNDYLDGRFRIVAIDSVGQQTSKDFDIPGFTVALVSELNVDDRKNVKLLKDSLAISEKRCYDYKLVNYGKFQQNINISGLINNNPALTIDLPKTFILAPGAEINFQVCFYSDVTTFVIDSLKISDNCNERFLLAIDLFATKDENAPQVSSSGDPCNQFIEIVVTDSLRSDIGIDEIKIIDSTNLKVTTREISDRLNFVTATVIDPYEDSYIKIQAIDKQGNISEFERSIPGYTIDFEFIEKIDDKTFQLDFGNRMIGVRYCDSVRLTNYGKYEIIINNPRLSENVQFSIPPSQIPLIILPGESFEMKICYLANRSDTELMSDTVTLGYNCLDKFILVLGQPDSLIFDGDTKCDIPLIFEVAEVPNGAFASGAYPNPSGGIVQIDINNPEIQNVAITISDLVGVVVKSYDYNNLAKGFYRVPLDVSSLSDGQYSIFIRIGNESFFRTVVIVK